MNNRPKYVVGGMVAAQMIPYAMQFLQGVIGQHNTKFNKSPYSTGNNLVNTTPTEENYGVPNFGTGGIIPLPTPIEVEGGELAFRKNSTGKWTKVKEYKGPSHAEGGIPDTLNAGDMIVSKKNKERAEQMYKNNDQVGLDTLFRNQEKTRIRKQYKQGGTVIPGGDDNVTTKYTGSNMGPFDLARQLPGIVMPGPNRNTQNLVNTISPYINTPTTSSILNAYPGSEMNPISTPVPLQLGPVGAPTPVETSAPIDIVRPSLDTPLSLNKSTPTVTGPVGPGAAGESATAAAGSAGGGNALTYTAMFLPDAIGMLQGLSNRQKSPEVVNENLNTARAAIEDMPTKFEIQPQLNEAKRGLNEYNRGVDNAAGAGAGVRNARRLAGLSNYNTTQAGLYGQKFNTENQMLTQKLQAKANLEYSSGEAQAGRKYQKMVDDLQTDANARYYTNAYLGNMANKYLNYQKDKNMVATDMQKYNAMLESMPYLKEYYAQLFKPTTSPILQNGQVNPQ